MVGLYAFVAQVNVNMSKPLKLRIIYVFLINRIVMPASTSGRPKGR